MKEQKYISRSATPVGSSGGSLGGSLFGGLAQSAGGVISSVLNARYASKEAAKQRDWQYQMWQAQNNYNHPANMAARMRAAGLNPYTMTGAEPAGSVGSGASAGGAPFNMSMDPLGAFRTIAEISNLEADSELKGSEYDLNLAKTAQTVLLYQLGLIDKKSAERDLSLFLDATNSENPYKIDYANKQADTLAKEASARSSDAAAAAAEYSVERDAEYLRLEQELLPYRIQLLEAQSEDSRNSALRNLREAAAVKWRVMFDRNSDNRAQSLHRFQVQAARYAAMLGATEAEIAEINKHISSIWIDKDRGDFVNAVLDFIHSNVRLSGSASYSRN